MSANSEDIDKMYNIASRCNLLCFGHVLFEGLT